MDPFIDTLQCLADTTRLRIVRLFADTGGELCVCELVDSLEVPQYNVSRHLALLRRAGILEGRKEGRWVYYALPAKPTPFLRHLLAAVRSISDSTMNKDRKELHRRFNIREGGRCRAGVQKLHLLPRSRTQGRS